MLGNSLQLTLLNVLVELVDEGIQLLPLQHGEIQSITSMHPLAQGAVGKQRDTVTVPQCCHMVGPRRVDLRVKLMALSGQGLTEGHKRVGCSQDEGVLLSLPLHSPLPSELSHHWVMD